MAREDIKKNKFLWPNVEDSSDSSNITKILPEPKETRRGVARSSIPQI